MSKNDWSTPVTGTDSHLEYRWSEYFHEDRSLGYYGTIVDSITGEEVEGLSSELERKLSNRAAQKRRQEIRLTLTEDKAEAILELFNRSREGEYLGQAANNDLLYVQDVAAIFDEPMGDTLSTVAELIEEGKIGLNGMIFTTNEAYERTFEHYREANGHRRLTASDFGYWSCAACGSFGDEWDDPADTPCETKETSNE
jgi:hypothetical protein